MRRSVATLAISNLARRDPMSPRAPGRPSPRPSSPRVGHVLGAPPPAAGRPLSAPRNPVAKRAPAELRRFARFLIVGLGGTLIDFVLLVLLKVAGREVDRRAV